MKFNTRKLLLGLALLGTTMVGSNIARADDDDDDRREDRKELKKERKEVKKARKEVRKADSPRERRDAIERLRREREDYRDGRGDFRDDYRDDRRDNRDDYRYDTRGNDRPNYGRPYYDRDDYNRPKYDRPVFGQSGYGRPVYGNGNRTIEGVVTQDLEGDTFIIRATNGQSIRVDATRGESPLIGRGDTVRARGNLSGTTLRAGDITILRNR